MGGFLNQSSCCKELPVTTKVGGRASGSDEMWGHICINVNSDGKRSDWIRQITLCSPCSVILQIFVFVLWEHVNGHFPFYLSYSRQKSFRTGTVSNSKLLCTFLFITSNLFFKVAWLGLTLYNFSVYQCGSHPAAIDLQRLCEPGRQISQEHSTALGRAGRKLHRHQLAAGRQRQCGRTEHQGRAIPGLFLPFHLEECCYEWKKKNRTDRVF